MFKVDFEQEQAVAVIFQTMKQFSGMDRVTGNDENPISAAIPSSDRYLVTVFKSAAHILQIGFMDVARNFRFSSCFCGSLPFSAYRYDEPVLMATEFQQNLLCMTPTESGCGQIGDRSGGKVFVGIEECAQQTDYRIRRKKYDSGQTEGILPKSGLVSARQK